MVPRLLNRDGSYHVDKTCRLSKEIACFPAMRSMFRVRNHLARAAWIQRWYNGLPKVLQTKKPNVFQEITSNYPETHFFFVLSYVARTFFLQLWMSRLFKIISLISGRVSLVGVQQTHSSGHLTAMQLYDVVTTLMRGCLTVTWLLQHLDPVINNSNLLISMFIFIFQFDWQKRTVDGVNTLKI